MIERVSIVQQNPCFGELPIPEPHCRGPRPALARPADLSDSESHRHKFGDGHCAGVQRGSTEKRTPGRPIFGPRLAFAYRCSRCARASCCQARDLRQHSRPPDRLHGLGRKHDRRCVGRWRGVGQRMKPARHPPSDPLVLDVARALARAHARRDIAAARACAPKEPNRANADLRPVF